MSGAKRSGAPNRKGHLHAGDLIALGSKSGSSKSSLRHSDRDDPKSSTSLKSVPPGASSSSSGAPPVKKFKPAAAVPDSTGGGLFSDPIRVSQVGPSQPPSSKTGPGPNSKGAHALQGGNPSVSGGVAAPVIEVRSGELLPALREAKSSGNDSKATKLLAGALRQLKLSRLKPDPTLNSALTTIAKESPELFSSPSIIDGLVMVLKRETSVIFKAKSNPSVYVLTAQLLLVALKDSHDWPEAIAKVYVEDSLGDRIWVDLDPCKTLVDNICTLFQTRPYNSGTAGSSSSSKSVSSEGGAKSVSSEGGGAGESGGGGEDGSESLSSLDVEVTSRFSTNTSRSLYTHVVQVVNEQLGRHNMPADNVSRNLLRFFMSAVGFPELRLLVAQKIDSWIQNPKLGKLCQELLMTVAVNCHNQSPEDLNVIDALINIRLKTKLFSTQFVSCMKELVSSHPDNLSTVMKGVVNNELGPYRTPSNMALISMMIHSWPDDAAKLLGNVFQDFLTRKEDYLRALRGFLREVVRVVRSEFNFTAFARALMQERTEAEFTQLEQTHKERVALSLADLIACSSMLTANMLIREAYNGYSKGERAMVSQLQDFFTSLGLIQRDSVWWVHTIVPNMFRPQPVDYKCCMKKVLFLEPVENYSNKDNWPPEADRVLINRLMTEACLKEDTLMRVLVIGLTRELPLVPADAMDIADKLVARAANAHTEDIARLPSIERKELFNAIFDISAYRPPANIQLPEGYQPPNLAISKLYWKGWILLLVLSAFNPKTIGGTGWNEYPMLRSMMEMVMTNTYVFPMSMSLTTGEGVASTTESRENVLVKEVQLVKMEKEAILEYENHLASSSSSTTAITEANSYLLNQVTQLQPKRPARRIPAAVIELIKTVNRTLKLGHHLCLCRSPDFLLEVIKKQGTMESMKWLTDLVEASHSSLEVLPIPCLCEFLMAGYQDKMAGGGGDTGEFDSLSHRTHYKRKKSAKDKVEGRHRKLIVQLKNVLVGPDSSPEGCSGVLEYFLDKLTQSQLTPRKLALKALQDILATTNLGLRKKSGSQSEDTEDDERQYDTHSKSHGEDWLTEILPNLTHFAAILPRMYPLILRACLVETNLRSLQGYINFLTQYPPHEKLYQSTVEMSRVMVDRFSTVGKLFNTSDASINSLTTLGSLLSMLRDALQAALHSQMVPELSSSADFLLISFPTSGEKGIIHLALIEAIFLFISCSLAQKSSPMDFKYFLDMWFPTRSKNKPETFTVETKEPVPLPPASILPQMLFSTNQRILEVAVQSASPVQLCTFVQKFGCPCQSVERVLEKLDSLCEDREASANLRRSLDDPVKVSSFLEIHFLRGVKSGRVFHIYLQGLASLAHVELPSDVSDILEQSPDTSMNVEASDLASPSTDASAQLVDFGRIPQEKMEQHLLQIFTPSLSRVSRPVSELQKELEEWLKSLILKSLSGVPNKSVSLEVNGLVAALHKLVTGSSVRRQFLEGMIKHRFSLSLIRMLTKIHCVGRTGDLSDSLFMSTILQVIGLVDSKRVVSVSGLSLFRSVMTACAEKLEIRKDSNTESSSSILLSSQVKQTCKEMSMAHDPFEKETALVKMATDVVQSASSCLVEDILSLVAKRSISLELEPKCISFIHKIKTATSARLVPLALQCFPDLFENNVRSKAADDVYKQMEVVGGSQSLGIAVSGDLSGLFVDWLEILDPQVVHLSPESSMQMVFGSVPNSKLLSANHSSILSSSASTDSVVGVHSPLLLSGQGYLLGRLAHDASWPTLVRTLSSLLDLSYSKEWINPSAVLDFIWACLHKPSLWQERVKKEAVVNSCFSLGIDEDCCMELTPSQLESLVGYILKEAAGYIAGTKGLTCLTAGDERELSIEAKEVIYSRLPLLMTCCHDNDSSLRVIVKLLQTNTSFPSLSWQLLVQLYHANERVIFAIDHPHTLSVAALDSNLPSKLDTELHYLLSAMADTSAGVESREKMTSSALLCRKIAILHPALMLRQLPMMGWLLRGRAHLTVNEFRNQNHKQVFANTFSILELLQPLVFKSSQTDALNSCLEAFFEFLKNQCLESKKYQAFVTSFADFLVKYAQFNRDKASTILFEHLEILRSLSEVYTNKKSNLKSLIECFPRPTEGVPGLNSSQPPLKYTAPKKMTMVPPVDAGHNLSHEQVMPFLKKLESGRQTEDILKVLQDLDETSHHSVDILKHFVPELCRIIQDPELATSRVAHNLLLRHFKRSPSSVGDLLPSFITCLESQDYRIVMAAVGSVKDLVLLCKAQDAHLLLNTLFSLCVHPSYSCTSELIEAVEACTLHTFR